MRRGWIQQEVAHGALDELTVRRFLQAAIAHKQFGVITTLVRRRSTALQWLMALAESAVGKRRDGTRYKHGLKLNQFDHDELNHGIDEGTKNSPSGDGPLMHQVVKLILTGSCRVIVRRTIRESVSFTIQPLPVDQLASVLSKPQQFDPKNLYAAVMLLRAFAESELESSSHARAHA